MLLFLTVSWAGGVPGISRQTCGQKGNTGALGSPGAPASAR